MKFRKNLEVILIEDDPYDAELLMRVFKKHNFASDVVLLRDGVEALDYFFKNPKVAERECSKSKIVFLDLKMPRVDGIEVLRRLKADSWTKDIPIIILTGSKEEKDLKNAYALGVASFITKPLKSEQFVSLMSEFGAKLDIIEGKVRILILEDNPEDAELIKRELQKSIYNSTIEVARDKEAFHDALDRFSPDIILTDYNIPGFNGIAAMYQARQHFPDIPTILVSGAIGEEAAVEALKSGVNDYVLKSRLSRIGPITNRALQEAKQMADRKKAEEALKESEERWATTLSSIGDSVIATDVNGKITFMNRIAEELTGWSLAEASHKPMREVFPLINEETRKEVENPVVKVLKEGAVVGLTNHTILIRKDGAEIPIDDSGAPIKNQSGIVTGVVLVFHDITERRKAELELKWRTEELENTQKKLEENAIQLEEYSSQMEELAEKRANQLKDSERLAAIGATAGMVGHDIRNPLQAMTGDLFLARSELLDLPDNNQKQNALESLSEIEKNVDYINKIVADLQDFARPLNPRAQETNIKSLFNEIGIKNGIPENIKLAIEVEDNAERIKADPDYLKRIVSNLVLNAVQAMPNGGKLTIGAYADKQTNDVIITVKDTGVGIPENIKPKLFTPMMTTKSKGQGFGLAVVKRMTEGLGGTVTFESQEGKGTTFIVSLPTQRAKR